MTATQTPAMMLTRSFNAKTTGSSWTSRRCAIIKMRLLFENGFEKQVGLDQSSVEVNDERRFTYQWNRAGTPIGGAPASTYVPVSADVGNTLTISVTATNGAGSSTPAASAATSAVIDRADGPDADGDN
jgi:hypothetical protein